MTDAVIASAVRHFICTELAPDVDAAEIDGLSLLDSGVLDSLGIMTLLSFIEDRFQIRVPVESIEPAQFENVSTISALITHMRHAA